MNGFGYPFEEHFIESEDGYIISLHRIPFSKKVRSLKTERPVALFQHGLLAASDTWLFRGPNKDLGKNYFYHFLCLFNYTKYKLVIC